MSHSNQALLQKMYSDFAKGDFKAMLSACPDNVTFELKGKSKLAGKYTKENFVSGFCEKLSQMSAGSFQIEIHDVLASDRHGLVLGTVTVSKEGQKTQLRTVHVWRIENGKPVAGYEYPRDMYQFDAIFG